MHKTNENLNGVMALIDGAKICNPQIGEYVEHFINDKGKYTVLLTNGRIEVSRTFASDFEVQPSSIGEAEFIETAGTFIIVE